ncbi:unnamed protein product [Paramecium pentaurelia]|uniref:Uncharacterized protein n=1 Tax=Paramecium pentaurelia TaxID=43138 RepID=A0A8S1T774_9CILI|nr:unnamed protein product [Paramecium pentaurelia]
MIPSCLLFLKSPVKNIHMKQRRIQLFKELIDYCMVQIYNEIQQVIQYKKHNKFMFPINFNKQQLILLNQTFSNFKLFFR